MKKIILSLVLVVSAVTANAQFSKWFFDKTMRYDFYHCGNSKSEEYFFKEVKEEPFWGGSKVSLIDPNNYGVQMFKIIDEKSEEVIYSRTYCTLFNEWQTVEEATTCSKAFPESVIFPYPKNPVKIEIYGRNKKGHFEKKHEHRIDPESYFVNRRKYDMTTFEVQYTGNPANRVDIVLIPEGYGEDQMDKFKEDCNFFASELMRYSPFKENAAKFNVRGVWSPSKDEGVTIPGEHMWRRTATDARFYTFDSERYQMTEDFQKVRDIAGNVPYDYIYILSNTQKYGGGAIYNFYGISAAGHPDRTGKIYVHEFGHLFLGLGDEYVGGVSYSEFYKTDIEPWEENLTTLKDFKKKQWYKMLDKDTPVPTPIKENSQGILGVYEGGGYVDKGVYRPWVNCLMNNIHTIDIFCPVCSWSIEQMINLHCK